MPENHRRPGAPAPPPPHPATLQRKEAAPPEVDAARKPPHPAKVAQRREAPIGGPKPPPHPAKIAQPQRAPDAASALPPHSAKVVQRAFLFGGSSDDKGSGGQTGKKKGAWLTWDRRVVVTVGRRTAFFNNSPATHAVFAVNNTKYGLKGDLGGGEIAVDDNSLKADYVWVPDTVVLSGAEMTVFWAIAQAEATAMTYTLFTHNCYSPVTKALVGTRNSMAKNDPRRNTIDAMLDGLGGDNFGLGSYAKTDKTKYAKKYQ